MVSKWLYLSRTIENFSPSLEPLEQSIGTELIPALTGRSPANDIQQLRAAYWHCQLDLEDLLTNPTQTTINEFHTSTKITEDLRLAIIQQDPENTSETVAKQLEVKRETNKLKRNQAKEAADQLREGLPQSLQRSMLLAQEKGACLPPYPSKSLASLYIRELSKMPSPSDTTGSLPQCIHVEQDFRSNIAYLAPKGDFLQSGIRDLTANLLTEVCSDV